MSKKSSHLKKGIPPIAILPIGFFGVIALGTLLLTLPISTVNGEGLSVVDAIFTATSATCVTGLTVVDIGNELTMFGQAVMLFLIQIGGLGFMAVATLLFMLLGKKISLYDRMTIAESLSEDKLQGVVKLCSKAIYLTIIIEFFGVAILSGRFIPQLGLSKGLWYAIFHSVSAFCNAGFDLMGNFESFMPLCNDVIVNLTAMGLIVTGGLGFAVLLDVGGWFKGTFSKKGSTLPARLQLHSKIVLATTAILIFGGALLFLLFEGNNADTIGNFTFGNKAMASMFQSVTCRTAGFNTISQAGLSAESKILSCVLMLVGASPAGTGGGIKTTTLAVILVSVMCIIKNRPDTEAFGRRISHAVVQRAFCILVLAITLLLVFTCAICYFEHSNDFSTSDVLFESVSALSTTGLSTGITTSLKPVSLMLLSVLMFVGRVGMLTLAFTLTGIGAPKKALIRYPEGDVHVG